MQWGEGVSTIAGDDDEVGGVVGDCDIDGLRCKSDDLLLLKSVRLVLRVLMKKMYNGYNHNRTRRKTLVMRVGLLIMEKMKQELAVVTATRGRGGPAASLFTVTARTWLIERSEAMNGW